LRVAAVVVAEYKRRLLVQVVAVEPVVCVPVRA
jgi:hypothetical protein